MDHPGTDSGHESKLRFWKRVLKISIGLIVVPPLTGCAGTVFGMIEAFQTLSIGGESDPSVLAGDVSHALTTTAIGLAFSIAIGLPVFVVSLLKVLRLQRTDD